MTDHHWATVLVDSESLEPREATDAELVELDEAGFHVERMWIRPGLAKSHEHDAPIPESTERDEREWILRWDHRQLKHYIDGPSDGRQMEGLTVIPAFERTRVERESKRWQHRAEGALAEYEVIVNIAKRIKAELESAESRVRELAEEKP
jgi:hypothetical protein